MNNQKTPFLSTQALVRSGVLCSLFEVLPEYRPNYKEVLPRKSLLQLKGGRVKRFIEFNKSGVTELESSFFPSMILNFLNEKGLVKKLSGNKATVIPIPLRNGALSGLKSFMKLSSEISGIMSADFEKGTDDYLLQTKLLLTAALRGVCEVGMYDHWVKVKAQHIPLGVLKVIVGDIGSPDYFAFIVHNKDKLGNFFFRFIPGTSNNAAKYYNKKANALLAFQSMEIAGNVLRGKVNAMEYLGSGQVGISGKIPFIQGIFPLLDRFSAVMENKV